MFATTTPLHMGYTLYVFIRLGLVIRLFWDWKLWKFSFSQGLFFHMRFANMFVRYHYPCYTNVLYNNNYQYIYVCTRQKLDTNWIKQKKKESFGNCLSLLILKKQVSLKYLIGNSNIENILHTKCLYKNNLHQQYVLRVLSIV